MRLYSYKSILLPLIIILSCQVKKENLTCEHLNEIYENDQRYRQRTDLFSPYFFVLDSLHEEEGLQQGYYPHELKQKTWKILETRPKPDSLLVDSLWHLQANIDSVNVLQLLNVLNEYGFKTVRSLDYECNRMTLVTFVHTPEALKDTVRAFINKFKDSIPMTNYNHISWHLDGRQGK